VAAAKAMAALHFAIRAYAAQGDTPSVILTKLGALLDIRRDGHFATVLMGRVDVPGRRLTLVNAGHLPPLIISGAGAEFASVGPSTPIGVDARARYEPVEVSVPRGASVLAYTDGLVERRGEILDAGLDRLRRAAIGDGQPGALVDRVIAELVPNQSRDDIALLELRWTR
jgi:serine phosphatase RsbU (regulator of sigma subunit)